MVYYRELNGITLIKLLIALSTTFKFEQKCGSSVPHLCVSIQFIELICLKAI